MRTGSRKLALDGRLHGLWAGATLVGLAVSVREWPVAPVFVAGTVLAGLIAFPAARGSALGVFTGAGLFALAVAFVHRNHPNVCWDSGSEAGCDSTLDWHLWLPIGLAFFAIGVVGQSVKTRVPGG